MNRSRLAHLKLPGLCFMHSFHTTYDIGAQPIGRPGWPELAFSTPSMERNRIAFTHLFTSSSDT